MRRVGKASKQAKVCVCVCVCVCLQKKETGKDTYDVYVRVLRQGVSVHVEELAEKRRAEVAEEHHLHNDCFVGCKNPCLRGGFPADLPRRRALLIPLLIS